MKEHPNVRSQACAFAVALLTAGLCAFNSRGLAASGGEANSQGRQRKPSLRLTFDDVVAGLLPQGWRCEATNPNGRPNPWQVQTDKEAASGHQVLALPKTPRFYGGTFNLCWTDTVRFKDGTIQVKVRAHTGDVDQGGGLMWRARDANNYYVTRWNPLEDNFRLYSVKDGHRKQIATADVKTDPKAWHTIRIRQQGSRITCWLDDEKLLTATDTTFTEPGGVGLWTKADAASSFDDLIVRARKPKQ